MKRPIRRGRADRIKKERLSLGYPLEKALNALNVRMSVVLAGDAPGRPSSLTVGREPVKSETK
jgi:hypothetical protein